jgi:S1-C subfamily serine protease
VKNSEDFSFLLNEAGGGASVQFTVLRAAEKIPREVTIKLSEAFNLRRATETNIIGFQGNANLYAATVGAATANVRRDLDRLTAIATATQPVAAMPVTPALPTSIVADLDWLIVPSDKSQMRAGSPSMLLVNVVRAGSPASKLGLRAGDIIVRVNGKTLTQNDWPEKFLLRKASELSLVVMRGRDRITLNYTDK